MKEFAIGRLITFASFMKLTFWGAARQVTGSMYMLETQKGYRVLVDCGLDYEQQRHLHGNPSRLFPFDPAGISILILTHAHIDHSGNIPNLVSQGFRGHIFCTPATADIVKHLLLDSANIQAGDARKAKNRSKKGRRAQDAVPLFTQKDVMNSMEQVITLDFHKPFRLNDGLQFTFYEAGHLLGAASVLVEFTENGQTQNIGFTGDLGRNNSKLVKNPEQMPELNYLITESTYGGRMHKVQRDAESELLHHINETCVKINGKLVIPAFSVGRTQAIIYTLNRLDKQGLLPRIKVFVDSPLALRTTPYYEQYQHQLNEEAKAFYAKQGDLFDFENLTFVQTPADEKDLFYCHEPYVIISAAGMVEGGRIQEHVKNHVQNPFSTILIAGYCAEGTLGARLLSGQKTVKIKGKELRVYSQITSTDVFSSHADQEQLIQNTLSYNSSKLKQVFLTHGDEPSMATFETLLRQKHFDKITIPVKGQEFTL